MLLRACPTGDEWDRYLLSPVEARDADLTEHLFACPFCRVTVRQCRADLDALGFAVPADTDSETIILRPMTWDAEIVRIESRLAAQSGAEATWPKTVSLVSSDRKLLLKAVQDTRTKETWLYLMADEPSLYRNVLVRFPDEDREFVTDEAGRIALGQRDQAEVSLKSAEVRLPRAVFSLSPMDLTRESRPTAVLRTEDGSEIRVTVAEIGASRQIEIEVLKLSRPVTGAPVRVAARTASGGELAVIALGPGAVQVPGVAGTEQVQIFVYQ